MTSWVSGTINVEKDAIAFYTGSDTGKLHIDGDLKCTGDVIAFTDDDEGNIWIPGRLTATGDIITFATQSSN